MFDIELATNLANLASHLHKRIKMLRSLAELKRNSGFHTFCQLPQVFWRVTTRSLVPKVVDSNCGAENVPVVKI